MAYYCSYTPPDDYTWQYVAPINYFSNPDVSYMGLPTGTATANNAKVVRENMVRPSSQTARNRRGLLLLPLLLPAYTQQQDSVQCVRSGSSQAALNRQKFE